MIGIQAAFMALGLSLILGVVAHTYVPRWEERGITSGRWKWKTIFTVNMVFAIVSSATAAWLGAPLDGAAALGILAWMVPLVTVTDYTTYLIPREISVFAYCLPLVLMVIYMVTEGSWQPLVQVAYWMILVVVMFGLALFGMIGMGDIRLFILAGTSLAWWTGAEYVYVGFMAAVALQLLLSIGAKFLGKGRYEERKALVRSAETSPPIMTDEEGQQEVKSKKKQMKLPAGPAFLYGFLAAGLVASALPISEPGDLVLRLYGM